MVSGGQLTIAGLGPGDLDQITPAVLQALLAADDVVGYFPYVARAQALIAHSAPAGSRQPQWPWPCIRHLPGLACHLPSWLPGQMQGQRQKPQWQNFYLPVGPVRPFRHRCPPGQISWKAN